MAKINARKRKAITAVVAIMVAAVILLSGTLAWQSLNQEALNEVYSAVNPGGRLHDDFVDITFDKSPNYKTMTFNKDVYVENFTSLASNGVQIYARVRLDEYMELGKNAGLLENGIKPTSNEAESIVPGSRLEDKSTWRPHIPGDTENPFLQYWNWETGGGTTYMPTFDKDNTSTDADINGTFKANFEDYVDYSVHKDLYKEATYSDKKVNETHHAQDTISGTVITMQEWIEEKNMEPGDYWVWDEDGWAYWANPINPDTATGLLLDMINRTEVPINEDWYYGINVVAQFITGDSLGDTDNTGFYDLQKGDPPSDDALLLLSTIGVDVPIEVSTYSDLQDALNRGGRIVLTQSVAVPTNLVVTQSAALDLGENKIYNLDDIKDETVLSLISVRGSGTTLTINGGIFDAFENDCYAVDVRNGAKVVINGGTFVGNISAVYVSEGNAVINGGEFSIYPPTDGDYGQMIGANNANLTSGKAHITICGGTFHGFDPSDYFPVGYKVTNSGDTYTVSAE